MLRICQGTIWLDEYITPEGEMSTEIVGQWNPRFRRDLIFSGAYPKIEGRYLLFADVNSGKEKTHGSVGRFSHHHRCRNRRGDRDLQQPGRPAEPLRERLVADRCPAQAAGRPHPEPGRDGERARPDGEGSV